MPSPRAAAPMMAAICTLYARSITNINQSTAPWTASGPIS